MYGLEEVQAMALAPVLTGQGNSSTAFLFLSGEIVRLITEME